MNRTGQLQYLIDFLLAEMPERCSSSSRERPHRLRSIRSCAANFFCSSSCVKAAYPPLSAVCPKKG